MRVKYICAKEVYFEPHTGISINYNDVRVTLYCNTSKKDKNILVSVMHRHPNDDMTVFEKFSEHYFPQMIKHQKTLFLLVILEY